MIVNKESRLVEKGAKREEDFRENLSKMWKDIGRIRTFAVSLVVSHTSNNLKILVSILYVKIFLDYFSRMTSGTDKVPRE